MYARVMVPVDGSEHAQAAVEHAIGICERMGARLHILNVVWTGLPYASHEAPGFPEAGLLQALQDHGQRVVARVEQQARQAGLTDVIATVTEGENVADAILAQAQESDTDLLVMGTRGRKGVARWMLGSVTETVLRRSTIPVMAIHANDEVDRVP